MHRADKAVLRLAIGMGLSTLVAYGMGMTLPFAACLMTVLLLCKPGPPLPFVKGMVVAVVVAGLLGAGILMVPILENYAVTGVLLTGVVLFAVFLIGARNASAPTPILVIAFALIPVAGVAEQALAGALSTAIGVGLAIGVVVSGVSHALFPDDPPPTSAAAQIAVPPSAAVANRAALRATLVVMPVFVVALTNPALYIAAIMKSSTLGQQAGVTNARSAGREVVGSTLMGALLAVCMWFGLSLWPNLWMLTLWMVAAALWVGRRIFRARSTRWTPSFWVNALITMLILLGPAIEDSASGKDVYEASLVRVTLFIVVSLYAWATIWIFEHWLAPAAPAPVPRRG